MLVTRRDPRLGLSAAFDALARAAATRARPVIARRDLDGAHRLRRPGPTRKSSSPIPEPLPRGGRRVRHASRGSARRGPSCEDLGRPAQRGRTAANGPANEVSCTPRAISSACLPRSDLLRLGDGYRRHPARSPGSALRRATEHALSASSISVKRARPPTLTAITASTPGDPGRTQMIVPGRPIRYLRVVNRPESAEDHAWGPHPESSGSARRAVLCHQEGTWRVQVVRRSSCSAKERAVTILIFTLAAGLISWGCLQLLRLRECTGCRARGLGWR